MSAGFSNAADHPKSGNLKYNKIDHTSIRYGLLIYKVRFLFRPFALSLLDKLCCVYIR